MYCYSCSDAIANTVTYSTAQFITVSLAFCNPIVVAVSKPNNVTNTYTNPSSNKRSFSCTNIISYCSAHRHTDYSSDFRYQLPDCVPHSTPHSLSNASAYSSAISVTNFSTDYRCCNRVAHVFAYCKTNTVTDAVANLFTNAAL